MLQVLFNAPLVGELVSCQAQFKKSKNQAICIPGKRAGREVSIHRKN